MMWKTWFISNSLIFELSSSVFLAYEMKSISNLNEQLVEQLLSFEYQMTQKTCPLLAVLEELQSNISSENQAPLISECRIGGFHDFITGQNMEQKESPINCLGRCY